MPDEMILDETAVKKPRPLGKISLIIGISSVVLGIIYFVYYLLANVISLFVYLPLQQTDIAVGTTSFSNTVLILSLIVGLLFLAILFLGFVLGVVGIIIAIMAMKQARASGATDVSAIIGLILSCLGLLPGVFYLFNLLLSFIFFLVIIVVIFLYVFVLFFFFAV